MKFIVKIIVVGSVVACLISCASTGTPPVKSTQDELTFIVAADWRIKATERYHSSE